jgi:hypothetical protein
MNPGATSPELPSLPVTDTPAAPKNARWQRRSSEEPGTRPGSAAGLRLHWWKEVILVLAFYGVYSLTRNTQGSARVSTRLARNNALRLIRFERWLGLYHERRIQHAFLTNRTFIQFWNVYYGLFHFVVTLAGLVWCFRVMPRRYPRLRNTLLATTALALIGFTLFPLMPPRLLPAKFGFVDTLHSYGGLWSFDSGPIAKASNQYAAMPSLHFGWSGWCVVVLWPWARTNARKAALLIYPLLTTFAIVVTANHFWLDAVGGFVILAVGHRIGILLARFKPTLHRPTTNSPTAEGSVHAS